MRKLPLAILLLFLAAVPPAFAQQAFSGVFHQTETPHIYLYEISWEELRSRNDQLAGEGFELVDVEAVQSKQQTRYWAIWREGPQQTRIERAAGWENMLKLKHRMAGEGWMLQDVEGFLEADQRAVFLGIWVKGSQEHKVWKFDSWEGLVKQTKVLGQGYFQLTDIEAFTGEYGATSFLAVYQKLPPTERAFPARSDNPDQFYKDKIQRTKSGYAIVDYETYQDNGITYLVGLYKKNPVKDNCRHRLDWNSFVTYQQFLGKNHKLTDIEVSEGDGNLIAPPFHTSRVDHTPNISQQVLATGKSLSQGASCAAANVLVWLSQRGFPRLYNQQDPSGYEALAQLLAGNEYIKENGRTAADLYAVTEGLAGYILDRGYDVKEITAHGIQGFDADRMNIRALRQILRTAGQPEPLNIDFAKEGLVGNSIVLLQWGIYEPAPQDSLNRDFNKIGERWATAVGYGVNEYGNENPGVLIVHSPTAGGEAPLYLRVKDLDTRVKLHPEARLHLNDGQTVPAGGQQYLENALQAEGDRFAVWENILVIKLKEPSLAQSELLGQD